MPRGLVIPTLHDREEDQDGNEPIHWVLSSHLSYSLGLEGTKYRCMDLSAEHADMTKMQLNLHSYENT